MVQLQQGYSDWGYRVRIFDRLGSEEFLVGCERCLDQNQNECLHHVIWAMAPKEQYTSQQEASLAVALSVLV